MTARSHSVSLSLTALAGALCLTAFTLTPADATAKLPYGPGPQVTYKVQPQPAPGSCHFRFTKSKEPLPDAHCTPGSLNPKVTQATIHSTICVSGYTSKIRPSAYVTGKEKRLNAKSYSYTASLSDAEYDHLVSLELGGDPNDPRNLWVEPPSPGHKVGSGVYNPKDKVENLSRNLICSGKVPLKTMQLAIAANWTTALAVVGHPNGT